MANGNDMGCDAFLHWLSFKRSHYLYFDKYLREVGNSPDTHARTGKQYTTQWFVANANYRSGAFSRQKLNSSAKLF